MRYNGTMNQINEQRSVPDSTRISEYVLDGTPSDVIERYEQLPNLARTTDFGQLDRNIVVIDTETTGLSPHHDELIQIAAARLECGEITDWFITFVNPGRPLSDEIIHLTNIHDSDLAVAPTPQEALADLVEFSGDATMVAHNASFDRGFVTRHPEGYPLLENRWVDTLDLSRIALPRLKSHRLIDLVHAFGAPISTHRADDDVAATCVIYRILLAAVISMPEDLVHAIAGMDVDNEWQTVHVFRQLVNVLQDPVSSSRPLFSLRELRRQRILELPTRPARRDADDLVGTLVYPTEEEITHAFSENGVLGHIYADYEPRDEQRAMALSIADTLAQSENLAVEAGTGVGKSMAYLVPAALFSQRNDVSVGIATKTNSLLDQLVYHELPALAAALEKSKATASTDAQGESPAAQPISGTSGDNLKTPPLTWAPPGR